MNFNSGNDGNIRGTSTYQPVRLTFNKLAKASNVFVERLTIPLNELNAYIRLMDTAQQDLPTLYDNIHQDIHITRQKRHGEC